MQFCECFCQRVSGDTVGHLFVDICFWPFAHDESWRFVVGDATNISMYQYARCGMMCLLLSHRITGFSISQLPKICKRIEYWCIEYLQGHVLIADWSVAHFVVSHELMTWMTTWRLCPFRRSFRCVLLLNQIFRKMYHSTIYHYNLSDQSALEICVRIRVRLRVALF